MPDREREMRGHIELPPGYSNGQLLGGRIYRITLSDVLDDNLTLLAKSFNTTPREYATFLLERSIQRASIEFAFSMCCVDILRCLGVAL